MITITKIRYDVYKAIKEYIEENGYSPSIREICQITGKKSPATIKFCLDRLRKDEIISYVTGKNRTIRILADESELNIIRDWSREI